MFALVTWFFGGIALDHAEATDFSSKIAEMHECLGTVSAFAFLIWGAIRLALWVRNRRLGVVALAILAVEIAGAALITVTS